MSRAFPFLVAAGALALLIATAPGARAAGGVVPVVTPTTDDPAALAARVRALEDRLQALWSVRQGPDVLALDTVDRLATRLLGAEARLAIVEEATGVREARAAHGHDEGAFQVALALVLLDDMDWQAMTRAKGADPARRQRALRVQQLVRSVAWPAGLQVKAGQIEDAWKAWTQAMSRSEPAAADHAIRLDALRHEMALAGSNWIASMLAAGGGAHDHSGAAQAAHADHSPHHGGQVAMQGDVHVELVSDGAGRWRAFLSDAYRKPIEPAGWTGSLILRPDEDAESRHALAEADGALAATGASASGSPVDVRVSLHAPPEYLPMLGPAARAASKAGDSSAAQLVEIDYQFVSEGVAGLATGDHPPGCPMAPAALDAAGRPAADAPQQPSRARRWR